MLTVPSTLRSYPARLTFTSPAPSRYDFVFPSAGQLSPSEGAQFCLDLLRLPENAYLQHLAMFM